MLTQEIETNVQVADADKQQVKQTKIERLKPHRFQPGQSGNPRGRKPLGITIAQHIRNIGSELIDVKDERLTRLDAAIRRAFEDARRGKTAALTELLNRGWGKPVQPIVDETELLKLEVLKQGLNVATLNDDPTLRAILALFGPAGQAAGAPQLSAPADCGVSEREEGAESSTSSDAT